MTPIESVELPQDGAGRFPFSQAIRHNDLLFVAGQIASDDPAWCGPQGDIARETATVMQRLGLILAAAGAGYGDILRVGIFMTQLDDFDRMNQVYLQYFSEHQLPARTCVGVARLLNQHVIEIDCVARLPGPCIAPTGLR
jgi:2-iminobutanoate/2-iminopropanoate deaminase